jgi:hypothetical protein
MFDRHLSCSSIIASSAALGSPWRSANRSGQRLRVVAVTALVRPS